MKPLKIAIVVGKFPVISETFIINQIGFVKAQGHQVDILCLGEKFHDFIGNKVVDESKLMERAILFKWDTFMPSVKLKRLNSVISILKKTVSSGCFFKMLATLNPFKYGYDAINFNQFFRTYFNYYFAIEQFDVVQVHFADNAVQILDQLSFFKGNLVVTFHGYDAHKFNVEYYAQLKNLKHAKYTVNTNFTKNKVLELGFLNDDIHLLPVSLDTNYFKPERKEHKAFNVLFVGRFIAFKAPLLAIKIVQKYKTLYDNDIALNLIGTGVEFESCKDYVETHNLQQCIQLLGDKSQDEVKTYMNNADVFLFPGIIDATGRCENQGLVIQEAQSMELPVLVSDVGGAFMGMIDEETGYVINEKDIDGFVDKLKYLYHNPEIRLKLGQKGREFVVENYDNLIIGEELQKIYGFR